MDVSNWNGNPVIYDATVVGYEEKINTFGHCIRGNGRSYGDASLDQSMISMVGYRKVLNIKNDILTVSSGFTLETVLNTCIQHGFFFPVIPGTSQVTIGGMVAADVHGKNHETHGTIGRWILNITLQLADHSIVTCSATEKNEIFRATIGGMGLTGIILEVNIQLEKLVGTRLLQTNSACESMSDLLVRLDQSKSAFKLGWCDLLNGGKPWLTETEFIASAPNGTSYRLKRPLVTVPKMTRSVMFPVFLKWYNRRHEDRLKSSPKQEIGIETCFFPLDRIRYWNRLFGSPGFYQYQFVLPFENCAGQIQVILNKIQRNRHKPWLTVIKKHGTLSSPGILSFPMHGFSFAFDFPNQEGIVAFFHELDELVTSFGGRIYLAKDAVLNDFHFYKMYPSATSFKTILRTLHHGPFTSRLARRLKLSG